MKQITAAICRTSLNETSEVEVGKEETAHQSCCSDLHILDLFLLGLESLTHLNEAREVLLEKGALEMLLGYFCLLCQKQVTDDEEDEEVCIVLFLCCHFYKSSTFLLINENTVPYGSYYIVIKIPQFIFYQILHIMKWI